MRALRPFRLERYFAAYEFRAEFNLCASDCESLTVSALLSLAEEADSTLLEARLGYTETAGSPFLRNAIAARYHEVPASSVVVAAPQELIFLALQCLVNVGDKVVVSTPAYASLLEVPRAAGAEVVAWPVRESDRGWNFDLDHLEALLPGASLLVVNTPHNPTGAELDAGQLQTLLAMCAAQGVRVFCDEMYRGLEPAGQRRPPSLVELDAQALVLAGVSKSHGLPGLRIGWLLCADEELRAKILAQKDYTTICPPAPSEVLAAVALQIEEKLFALHRAQIAENQRALQAFCDERDVLQWRAPASGPVTFLRSNRSAETLAAQARAGGVLLLPATEFEAGDDHLRFGLGRADFRLGLQRLREIWTSSL